MSGASIVRDSVLPAAVPQAVGEIQEILFPSDLSTAADRAASHARLLAERFQAFLVLYHAVEIEPGELSDDPQDVGRERTRRRERRAHEHLVLQAELVRSRRDVVVEPALSPAAAIVDLIRGSRPDLTVMATRGRRGLSQWILGSVAGTVLEQTHQPMLFVREPEHGTALPYRRIVVPTDMTAHSRRVFPVAAAIARAFSAEVLAVHVPAVAVGTTTAGITEAVEQVPSEQALVDFLRPYFSAVRVLPRIPFGPVWQRILEVAHDERADLVAMTTHWHDSLADRVLGTHAERVVHASPCPVLVT